MRKGIRADGPVMNGGALSDETSDNGVLDEEGTVVEEGPVAASQAALRGSASGAERPRRGPDAAGESRARARRGGDRGKPKCRDEESGEDEVDEPRTQDGAMNAPLGKENDSRHTERELLEDRDEHD